MFVAPIAAMMATDACPEAHRTTFTDNGTGITIYENGSVQQNFTASNQSDWTNSTSYGDDHEDEIWQVRTREVR